MWFKNRRAKFRQQNKQQQGTQSKPKPAVKRKSPTPPIQQVQEPTKASIPPPPPPPPPQQFNNFGFTGASWPNKHDIQEMANMQRQANYQKLINNGINAFSAPNFTPPSSQPPFSNPNHEQYYPYMANAGPMASEMPRNRIESSAMMC